MHRGGGTTSEGLGRRLPRAATSRDRHAPHVPGRHYLAGSSGDAATAARVFQARPAGSGRANSWQRERQAWGGSLLPPGAPLHLTAGRRGPARPAPELKHPERAKRRRSPARSLPPQSPKGGHLPGVPVGVARCPGPAPTPRPPAGPGRGGRRERCGGGSLQPRARPPRTKSARRPPLPPVTSPPSHPASAHAALSLPSSSLTPPPLRSRSPHLSSSCIPGQSSSCSQSGPCPRAASLPLTAPSARRRPNPEPKPCAPPGFAARIAAGSATTAIHTLSSRGPRPLPPSNGAHHWSDGIRLNQWEAPLLLPGLRALSWRRPVSRPA